MSAAKADNVPADRLAGQSAGGWRRSGDAEDDLVPGVAELPVWAYL